MRKIIADTHAHTIVSGHAYSTIREMASAAKRRGFRFRRLQNMRRRCREHAGFIIFRIWM